MADLFDQAVRRLRRVADSGDSDDGSELLREVDGAGVLVGGHPDFQEAESIKPADACRRERGRSARSQPPHRGAG